MRDGRGWHGGDADHIGSALSDVLDQFAGCTHRRSGDGLDDTATDVYDLREHHCGQFIRLAVSRQTEDSDAGQGRPIGSAGACLRVLHVLIARLLLRLQLALTPFLDHGLERLQDERVPGLLDLAATPMRFG